VTDPFLAEIRIFGGNFAPRGWALCDGQLMSISQNTALFSLLGTTYGGDGRVTFGLPNLQGSTPMQQGQGPGLSQRYLGEIGGEQYAHTALAVDAGGDKTDPGGNTWASARTGRSGDPLYSLGQQPNLTMAAQSTNVTGGSQPHNNMQPYLGLTFIIALQGVFPARG
jgi:microcystin-dependent protein